MQYESATPVVSPLGPPALNDNPRPPPLPSPLRVPLPRHPEPQVAEEGGRERNDGEGERGRVSLWLADIDSNAN